MTTDVDVGDDVGNDMMTTILRIVAIKSRR